ncbi:hypothetical protein MYX07_06275 [Patescibacteria group bacterium AH-259-L07]|nr:hypothetical protein [Patescibacteria group bacterium AH-259-L07]
MAKTVERMFTPLRVDHIAFACYDSSFWQPIFERFGFETVSGGRNDGVAMRHGNVRIVLIDPHHDERLIPFLVKHGDLQVSYAAIEVDSLKAALKELNARGIQHITMPLSTRDEFGTFKYMVLRMPFQEVTSEWMLVEREGEAQDTSEGLDHFAIGVRDLKKGEQFYHSLGFETIYEPEEGEIPGDYSSMETVALQRGNWVVALVKGVDKERLSQVSTYVGAHGDHAIQHAAIQFDNLPLTVGELDKRGTQFRLRRQKQDRKGDLTDIIHEGEDHSGPLFQCFTKPWAYRQRLDDPTSHEGGFFFELIQRIESTKKAKTGAQAFHDPTVIGLYRSIEYEEIENDTGRIFSDEIMGRYGFLEWLKQQEK